METFLAKIAKTREQSDDSSFYGQDGREQLVSHGLDFFLAGTIYVLYVRNCLI